MTTTRCKSSSDFFRVHNNDRCSTKDKESWVRVKYILDDRDIKIRTKIISDNEHEDEDDDKYDEYEYNYDDGNDDYDKNNYIHEN